MSTHLAGRLDDIDIQIDKIQRLIEGGSQLDPELAAGVATTEPMPSVQRKLDQSAAAIEALDRDLKKIKSAA